MQRDSSESDVSTSTGPSPHRMPEWRRGRQQYVDVGWCGQREPRSISRSHRAVTTMSRGRRHSQPDIVADLDHATTTVDTPRRWSGSSGEPAGHNAALALDDHVDRFTPRGHQPASLQSTWGSKTATPRDVVRDHPPESDPPPGPRSRLRARRPADNLRRGRRARHRGGASQAPRSPARRRRSPLRRAPASPCGCQRLHGRAGHAEPPTGRGVGQRAPVPVWVAARGRAVRQTRAPPMSSGAT